MLEEAELRARRFAIKYNAYMPEDATPKYLVADRDAMLQQIMRRLGKNCYVEPPFFIVMGVTFPSAPISMLTLSA